MSKQGKTGEDGQPKVSLYTAELDEAQSEKLRLWCDRQLWLAFEVQYALYAFKGDRVNVVAYANKKKPGARVVIQGKKTEDFVHFVLESEITGTPKLGYDEIHHPEWYEPHAGLDESGKGDFFGPVVSACVVADGDMVRHWRESGVMDSKRITSDKAILRLENIIRQTRGVVVETAYAGMPKYNELYARLKSQNRLLAWFHARALESALRKRRPAWGLLDQFTEQPLVQGYLKDDAFELRMRTKAESDPVVAAASIVARAEFVRQMEKLSVQCGEKLQKGASSAVREQGRKLVEKFGPEALPAYAKMHFRTAYEVLGLPPPPKVEFVPRSRKS